ncbi:MAG: VCBS repeat-containing protein, partial [Candidatus Latescibacterota bacterium]
MALLPLFILLLAVAPAQAITWNFDAPGDAQGWIARDAAANTGGLLNAGSQPPLRSEVAGGIWRILPHPFEAGREPAVELFSPLLKHDSALFDQVRLRFRVVHTRPILGSIYLLWTNATNEAVEGVGVIANPDSVASSIDQLAFYRSQGLTYTTDWQEVVFAGLATQVVTAGHDVIKWVWDGELLDVRLQLNLYRQTSAEEPYAPRPEDLPEAIEVDWIRLTGFEEQLLGELPPPAAATAPSLGNWFDPPAFFPVDQLRLGPSHTHQAILGDVDGDGRADLVALWSSGDEAGFLVAPNDGEGGFGAHPRIEHFPRRGNRSASPSLDGADLNGDGYLDVVLGHGGGLQVLENQQGQGWVSTLARDGGYPLGIGDADGDGDVDVWIGEYQASGWVLPLILLNDGQGHFDQETRMAPELLDEGFGGPHCLVDPAPGGHGVGALWVRSPVPGYKATWWNSQGQLLQESLSAEVLQAPLEGLQPGEQQPPYTRIRYVGDFDGDGDTDMVVVALIVEVATDSRYRGLDLLLNRGDGRLERTPWYGTEVALKPGPFDDGDVKFVDLDGEGPLDPVFVDSNFRGPAAVVGVGQRNQLPIQEGRYPLEGPGGEVVAGDVDGDGDTDLVVLESSHTGSGSGVYVLNNRLAERRTA